MRIRPLPAHSKLCNKLALAIGLLLAGVRFGHAQEERRNYFDDPFVQVTDGLANCPAQKGPQITLAEMQAAAHYRAERGTSCYQSGRCRLPNAYLYDKEIIPRVKKALLTDGGFGDTRVWVEGQRRWVWITGCVRTPDQSRRIESTVRAIGDVEMVINELVVLGQ